jgi:hypothetical protein
VDLKKKVSEWHKNLSKTDWNKFRLSLEVINKSRKKPSVWNQVTLEG